MSVAVEALSLLPIPPLASLSRPQIEGRMCIWSGEALNAETAVELGEREHEGRTAFLRASRPTVRTLAISALFEHCTGAEPCTVCKDSHDCPTGRALNQLIRQGRQ